jgi:hypothetical protein
MVTVKGAAAQLSDLLTLVNSMTLANGLQATMAQANQLLGPANNISKTLGC